jgi:hypothetical protein
MLSNKPAGPAQGDKLPKPAAMKKSGNQDDIDFLVEEELSRKSEQDEDLESATAFKVEISSKSSDSRR